MSDEEPQVYRLESVREDSLAPGLYAMRDWNHPRRLVEIELFAPVPRSVLTSISGLPPTISEFAEYTV